MILIDELINVIPPLLYITLNYIIIKIKKIVNLINDNKFILNL